MTAASIVDIGQQRPRQAAGGQRHPGGRSPSGFEESLLAALRSAISLIEATARIQKETAEVLCALAAQSQNETVTQHLRLAHSAAQELACGLGHAQSSADRVEERPQQSGDIRPANPYTEQLTAREKTVLRLLQGTLSYREIGQLLHISQNTIKTHTRAIYRKLGVSSRPEAIQQGRALGILQPGGTGTQ